MPSQKDGGSGREDGTGAYQKASDGTGPHEGAVYAVAGSSGQTSGGTLNHPAMFISLNSLGSMILEIDGNRLDAKFIDQTGATRDYFTITKGEGAPQLPSAPTNLTANAVSSSQIQLNWVDNSGDESGFKIERSTDNVSFTQIATVAANITSFANSGLTPSTQYFYRVCATNAVGDSLYSNTANATTQGTNLNAPTALSATAVAKNRINLAWTDNSTNETGFKIERSVDGVAFTQIATVAANAKTYSSTGLKANKQYWYRVRAYSGTLNSAYSNVATATTPRR